MPHRTTHRPLLIALLAAGVVLLPGCRQAGDGPLETAAPAAGAEPELDRNGRIARFNEAGDAQAGIAAAEPEASVPLPADFPADVHLPAPLRVDSAMDMAGLKMLNLTTPTTMAQVSADVEKEMRAQGWKREMAMQAGDGSTLVYSKDQRQTVYQLIRREQGGTQLAIRTGAGG